MSPEELAAEEAAELARYIARLSRTGTREVVELGPELRAAFTRLLSREGAEEAEQAFVRYRRLLKRADLHADAVTLAELEQAEQELAEHVAGAAGHDRELLQRELEQQRLALLVDKEALAEEVAVVEAAVRRRAAMRRLLGLKLDYRAAQIERGFLDTIRDAIRRFKAGAVLAEGELLLLRAYKKLRVIGHEWSGVWQKVFTYLREHAAGIVESRQALAKALEALEAARKTGQPELIREAEAAVTSARRSVAGYASKLKGMLGELYVRGWKDWKLLRESYMEVAQRLAAKLGPDWKVLHVAGEIRLGAGGKEIWDEAILLVRGDEAKLFLAAQHKVERVVSALEQIESDVVREAAKAGGTLPIITVEVEGELPKAFALSPLPPGETAHRYVLNAAEGRFSRADLARLHAIGVQVSQMHMDATVSEFDATVDALMAALKASMT